MTGALLPAGYETLEDANGVTVPGGLIWTYAAGTTTPLGTYTDNTLGVLNANPIIADGAGRWSAWAQPGTGYKLVFETPATPPVHGATIKTVDNLVAPLTDATAGATGGATVIADNTTGTVNNFILAGRTKDTLWLWNGSADLTLTGIAGGVQGDRIVIKNMSTVAGRQIVLSYMSAASSNPFYNLLASSLATTLQVSGWAAYVFSGGTWVMTDHNQGEWVDVPFSAANFSTPTAGATFVVTSTAVYAYNVIGKTVVLSLGVINSGTTTGAPVRLQVQLPSPIAAVSRGNQAVPFPYLVAGVPGTGLCSFQGSKLDLLRDVTGTPFGAGSVFVYITFSFSLA